MRNDTQLACKIFPKEKRSVRGLINKSNKNVWVGSDRPTSFAVRALIYYRLLFFCFYWWPWSIYLWPAPSLLLLLLLFSEGHALDPFRSSFLLFIHPSIYFYFLLSFLCATRAAAAGGQQINNGERRHGPEERERERESRSCLSFSPIFFCIRCWQHTVVHTLLIPSSTSYTHLGPADISFTSGRSIRTNLTPGHTKERIPSCVGGERYPRADGSRRQELTIDCCRQIVPHSARLTRYERERTISRRRAGEREGIHYSSKSSSTSSCCCSLCAISKVGNLSI